MANEEKTVLNTEEERGDVTQDEKANNVEMDANKNTKAKSKAKSEEEEESSDEDEENPGLYDKPLIVEGKRERKKTEFLVKDADEIKKPVPLQFNGTGDALGTMEVVNHELTRCTAFELKPLHKLLFGREGKEKEIKKNIKQFNGFKIEKGSKDYENKKFGLERFTMEGLKRMLEIFDLEKKGTREDYKERIFDFLLDPKETGRSLKSLQKKTQKKAAKKKSSGKGEKRKRTSSKSKSKKPSKSKEDVEDDDDKEEEEEEDESDKDSDDEVEQPKKKKAKTETPSKAKSTPKKSPSKGKKDAKPKKKSKPVTVKITAGKRTPKKSPTKKSAAHVEEADSSDDEPLSKKTKKQPPTNEELASEVKQLLKNADLDEVTVKSISKQVFAKYPDFDLTEKKGFIKETVYSVIAGESK